MSTTSDQELVMQAALAAGASQAEAAAVGEIAGADSAANALYAPQYRTEQSPVHQAVWGEHCPLALFDAPRPASLTGRAQLVMEQALTVVRAHQAAGTFVNPDGPYAGKLSDALMADLGNLGYYGALIPEADGGLGLSFPAFALEETRMATVAPSVAMQNSVHEAIGAVGPLLVFANATQRQRLRALATGRPQSCFALTESQGGSDIKNLQTRGIIEGDEIVITGQKWFITNIYPNGLMCLVCLLEGPGYPPSPQVVLVDLPATENEHYWLTRYRLTALQELRNYGVNFSGLRVPLQNWIRPPAGADGLTIAYHLLNRGRVSVCAVAGARLRRLLASMRLWGRTRVSLGQRLDARDLPLADYARLAGLIVCADALRDWTAWLLDQGYRGELETGAAKVLVTQLLGEAVDRIYPQFWGGRALAVEHPYAREIGELKAPEIYEGHNNMLALAWFAALTKQHGRHYYLPIMQRLGSTGNPYHPLNAWAIRHEIRAYAAWRWHQQFGRQPLSLPSTIEPSLAPLVRAASRGLQRLALTIDSTMQTYRQDLINRQTVVHDLSLEAFQYIAVLVTALHASRRADPVIVLAARTFGAEQLRRLQGGRRGRHQQARLIELGRLVRDDQFAPLAGVPEGELIMPWADQTPG